jgi:hypothetical protein
MSTYIYTHRVSKRNFVFEFLFPYLDAHGQNSPQCSCLRIQYRQDLGILDQMCNIGTYIGSIQSHDFEDYPRKGS